MNIENNVNSQKETVKSRLLEEKIIIETEKCENY